MAIFTRIIRQNKTVWGWAIYDWANSAFATTVMAGFFPIFFKNYWSFGVDTNVSTAQLGFGNSLGGLIVALLAPVLGAIADRGGARRRFLIFFAYLGVLMTAGLFLVQQGDWTLAILFYVMGVIGFSGANVFYDSLLPQIAPKENWDFVSGFGYSLGYLGGGVLFLLNVLMTLQPSAFGLPDAASAVRFSFLSVALWWGGFTIFTILWVKDTPRPAKTTGVRRAVTEGLRQFFATFGKIKHLKTVALFLLAYWLYIDGVHTIIRMAVDYGLSLGFKDTDLIVALLIVQFVGFPAAILYAKLGETWSVRKAIFLGIFLYLLITIAGVFINHPGQFYAVAVAIGCVQGGVQALSRSYYSRLIPHHQSAEFFGFYNMIGKFAVIIGPVLIGVVGLLVKQLLVSEGLSPADLLEAGRVASRWSLGSITILFVLGGILFYFVDEEKGEREIQRYVRQEQ